MSAPLILGTNSIKDVGYNVDNSLRFDDGSSDYLNFTASAGNQKTFTFSTWLKRANLGGGAGGYMTFFSSDVSVNDSFRCTFNDDDGSVDDRLMVYYYTGSFQLKLITNREFRDTSAWYHIVIAFDTTQATSSDRVKIYVNGVQETSFSTATYPSQNLDTSVNKASAPHEIGRGGGNLYFDGYLAETVLVDGTQLDATSFGEFDEDSGIWKPIDVSGLTFGTNGFYLDFEDSSALGNDVSGNNNDFTVNNLTSIDQTTDTCTNNYATLNPLHPGATNFSNCVFTDGNLEFESNETGYVVYPIAKSTIGVSSGKWYAEFKPYETNALIGISDGISNENFIGGSTSNGVAYQNNGDKRVGNTESSYGNSYTIDDIIGVAMDLDNNYVYFSKNGTFQNSGDPTSGSSGTGGISIPTSSTGVFHFAMLDSSSSGTTKITSNFGNPAFTISSGNSDANGYGNFEYSVPSGYYALNTKNLAEYG